MTQSNQNVALSPYTVWTLLTIIHEGAQGETARQLETVLNLPSRISKEMFRKNYKSYYKYLTVILIYYYFSFLLITSII